MTDLASRIQESELQTTHFYHRWGPRIGGLEGIVSGGTGASIDTAGRKVRPLFELEGRVGWEIFKDKSGSAKVSGPNENFFRDLQTGTIAASEYQYTQQKHSVGLTLKVSRDFGEGLRRTNLYSGFYLLRRVLEVKKDGNRIATRGWDLSLSAGPAIRSLESNKEDPLLVGVFATAGVGLCLDDDCAVSVGGSATGALFFGETLELIHTLNGRLVFD